MGGQEGAYTYIDDETILYRGRRYQLYRGPALKGQRSVIERRSAAYPEQLRNIPQPPDRLFVIGDANALKSGLAIIGARKATPYGLACARHFAELAALKDIPVISGGAFGCDAEAHRGALDGGGVTVAFLGGGCDQVYPVRHYGLFQEIIDKGGAVVSERPWGYPALPFTFRQRNRLIAGCARAVLIVEAGLPSGTFSTADEALIAGRDVLVVPSAITSKTSAGANRLLYQGALPVVDDESFDDICFSLFGALKQDRAGENVQSASGEADRLLEALLAEPLTMEQIVQRVPVPKKHGAGIAWLTQHLVELESSGLIARFPDGRYGPARL